MNMDEHTGKLLWSDRWCLGALRQDEVMHIFLSSLLMGLLFILFHLFGNTVENVNSQSAFVWMVARWSDKQSFGADYSHGFLIPFVSLACVWYRKKELRDAVKKISRWGMMVIIMALMLHWLGAKMQQTRISLVSFILLLWGIPFYFYGWQVAKIIIFPCAYLIFCVPLNFLDALSGPLQMAASTLAFNTLQGMGIECERVGTQLMSPYFQLNVEAPCSGLRSLLAMTALTAAYAWYTQKTFIRKWLLFMSSIPIAVAGNIGRIISIALVSISAGQQFGAGLHHDWSGYVLFSLAISLMIVIGKLLLVDYVELYKKCKKAF